MYSFFSYASVPSRCIFVNNISLQYCLFMSFVKLGVTTFSGVSQFREFNFLHSLSSKRTHTHTHTLTRVHTRTHALAHTRHTHTHTHTHIHTHTHTHARVILPFIYNFVKQVIVFIYLYSDMNLQESSIYKLNGF